MSTSRPTSGSSYYDATSYDSMTPMEIELRRKNEEIENRKLAAFKKVEETKRNQEENYSKLQNNYSFNDNNSQLDTNRPKSSKIENAKPILNESNADDTNCNEDTDPDNLLTSRGVTNDTKLKILTLKLKVAQDERVKLITEITEMSKLQSSHDGKLKSLDDENKRLNKALQNSESSIEKQKKNINENNQKIDVLEAEVLTSKKENENLIKTIKQLEADKKTRDLRLNRALEENDRLKSLAKDKSENKNSAESTFKTDITNLQSEIKLLSRQKNDILVAFKKQLKLIDILKRQKVHVEAAKLLSFSEEEFKKTLELQI